MDERSAAEFGIIYARLEYLSKAVSEVLSRLPEKDFVEVGAGLLAHFAKHGEIAIASRFPDTYLAELKTYPPAQLADADRRRQHREFELDPDSD